MGGVTKEEILKRRKEVARLYLEHGTSLTTIADLMKVNRKTIWQDLNKHIMPELSKNTHLANYWIIIG